ncbi:MAG: hypothetical protein EA361_04045 [Bacteroidetes bacterium]|nr:MAG: hypothetical protein EA361_04045 [Bacteroidota bacterium]
MGNPVSGQESLTVLQANHLRVYSFYKYGYNETYFRQNIRLINYGQYRHSSYDYAGIHLAYGLTQRLTIEHEAGYFIDKQLRFHDPELDALSRSGYGLSNGVVSLHYSVWNSKTTSSEISLAGGLKYPLSRQSMSVDGVELPVELQPSTGATGFVGRATVILPLNPTGFLLFIQHRYEVNGANKRNYTYGSAHQTSVSVGIPVVRNFQTMLQFRNEYRNADTTPSAARLASEGSNVVFVSPTLSWMAPGRINLAVFADIPLYKHYFGEQLSNRFATGVSISREFSFSRTPALP